MSKNPLDMQTTQVELPSLPGFRMRKIGEPYDFGRKKTTITSPKSGPEGLITHKIRDAESGLTPTNEWNTTHLTTFSPPKQPAPIRLGNNPRDRWLRLDRAVLRFYMYFREAVHESAIEVQRIRNCTLLYFLADSSIQIIEPKQENSGILQGPFLQKTPLSKLNMGKKLSLETLRVGSDLTLLGRTYRITDCDKTTREFYAEEFGIQQPDAEQCPDIAQRDLIQKPVRVSRTRSKQSVARLHGKVLNFLALWDGTAEPFGEKRFFTIHFFIADNTLEIREQHSANTGRGSFPVFLRRSVVPFESAKPPRNVSAQDLVCGTCVQLFGRSFQILSCDTQTLNFYSANWGIAQPRLSQTQIAELRDDKAAVSQQSSKSHGAEELLFGNNLADVMPRHGRTAVCDANVVDQPHAVMEPMLRFTCRLVTDSPYDNDREFVVTFFPRDATLNVYEPPRRNSGVMGGKYLERGAYRNLGTGQQFTALDFAAPLKDGLSCPVTIMRRKFYVFGADSATRRFYENLQLQCSESACTHAVTLLQERFKAACGGMEVRDVVSPSSRAAVEVSLLQARLAQLGVAMEAEELRAIQLGFPSGNGCIQYDDLCDAISRQLCQLQDNLQQDRELTLELFLGERRPLLRSFDTDNSGFLDFLAIKRILESQGMESVSPYDITAVMKKYDPQGLGNMEYNKLCDNVNPCVCLETIAASKDSQIRLANST